MPVQIASKSSYKVKLNPGKYWWCACGRSKSQPLCDSSHKTTEFTPVRFVITETKIYSLCGCKLTKTPPFCDHTHREIKKIK